MEVLDIIFIVIGVIGIIGVIYTVITSRFGVTKSLAVGEINYRHEVETFTLIYDVKHPPIQSIPVYRFFHWLLPITMSIGGPGARTWGTVRVYCLDAAKIAINEVEHFVDHHDARGRTIKLPRSFRFDPHIQYLNVEVTRHYPREQINELVTIQRHQMDKAATERWRYDLRNTTRRDVREFEIDMEEVPQSFSSFTIVQTSPNIDTRESDVVVHDRRIASQVGVGGQIGTKVIWHLPLLKQDAEGRLEFEFS